MSATPSRPPGAAPRVLAALLPIVAVVFTAYLVIGLALPVLPLYVHQGLGLGTFVVGLVAGSQFAASLVSRLWSGDYADRRGAKRAVVVGLAAAAVLGLLYLLSLRFVGQPEASVTIHNIAGDIKNEATYRNGRIAFADRVRLRGSPDGERCLSEDPRHATRLAAIA